MLACLRACLLSCLLDCVLACLRASLDPYLFVIALNVDDSIDSVAIWNVSWRNAVVEGKREAAREQHYLVLFGPSTGNPSLFGPSYVRRALLCFSSYTYLVLCCAVLCCAVMC